MPTAFEHPLSLWPSSALIAFVQRNVARSELYAGIERRTEQRLLLVMPVIVQAVDGQLAPVGAPQAMVIRDISTQSMGLVYEQPFEHPRIVVRLSHPEEGTLLAAEVRWSKPLGPFYHLGCEITAHLDSFPAFEK